jgi:hypothetical protein
MSQCDNCVGPLAVAVQKGGNASGFSLSKLTVVPPRLSKAKEMKAAAVPSVK